MNKIIFILLFSVKLFSAEFAYYKKDRFHLYFEKEINFSKIEYCLQILKNIEEEYIYKFFLTNNSQVKIYIYYDPIQFVIDNIGKWWEYVVFKTNGIYINNIDFLLEKNIFATVMKYAITFYNLIEKFKNKTPDWFLNGVALYHANFSFSETPNLKYNNFESFLKSFNTSLNEMEFIYTRKKLVSAISYLVNKFSFNRIIEVIKASNSQKDFEKNFFQYFGFEFEQFKELIIEEKY